MGIFLFVIVVVLGPSVAAVAWLVWYSGALKSSTGQGFGNRNSPTIS
jgi:hypothetical protein